MKKGIMLGVVLVLIVVALIVYFYFNSEKGIGFSREECQSQGGFHVQEQYGCPLNSEEIFRGSDSVADYLCCKSTLPLREADINWESLEVDSCTLLTLSEGGYQPPRLEISLKDSNGKTIEFSVTNENKENLLLEGVHSSEDGRINGFSAKEDEMEISLEEVEIVDNWDKFDAKGTIKIKKEVLNSVTNIFYPPVEIPFECANSEIY